MSTGIRGSGSKQLFLGEVLLADRVDLVGTDALSEGFGDGHVEASEQLSYRFSLTSKQHGHSLTAVVGNRHAPDRAHVAEGDLAMLREFLEVSRLWSTLWVRGTIGLGRSSTVAAPRFGKWNDPLCA